MLNLSVFIYLNERVNIDFAYPQKQMPVAYAHPYLIVSSILNATLFIGLYLALKDFKEAKWIGISIIVCWTIKILMILSLIILPYYPDNIKIHLQEITFLLGRLPLWFMLFAFLFVKSKVIKPYFLSHAVISIFMYFVSAIGPKLYDDFSIHCALINPDAMLLLAYLPIVILFIKLYMLSHRKVSLQNI